MFRRNLGFSTPVAKILKEVRKNLADLNASLRSLEQLDAGKRPAPVPPSNRIGRVVLGANQRRKQMSEPVGGKHSGRTNPHQSARSLPQGYAEIRLATHWSADAESWGPFMRKVILLPGWMLPAVQIAVRRRGWRSAVDPLEQIRTSSIREAHRLGLRIE
jgi:hypothetical protein